MRRVSLKEGIELPTSATLDDITTSLTLCIESVQPYKGKMFSLGCLWEMKNMYPILDCVGYLQSQGKRHLVFIQLSLHFYANHRKLSDIFRVSAPISSMPEGMPEEEMKSMSALPLFQFYCQRVNLKEDDDIIIIYISPDKSQYIIVTRINF